MGELEQHIADRVDENQALESRLEKQGTRIRKLETMDWTNMIREQTTKFIESFEIDRKIEDSVKEVVSSSVKQAMRAPLRARFKDLPTSDMKEILLQRMLEENYDKGNAEHRIAYEALQGSIHRDEDEDFDDDKAQVETKKKGKQDSPKPPPGSPPSPPPPPPPPSGASGASGTTGASDSAQAPFPPPPVSSTRQEDQSTGTAAPSSSKTAASAECSAWTTTDSQTKPSIAHIIVRSLYWMRIPLQDVQVLSSDDAGIRSESTSTGRWNQAPYNHSTRLLLQQRSGVLISSGLPVESMYDIAASMVSLIVGFNDKRFYIDRFSSVGSAANAELVKDYMLYLKRDRYRGLDDLEFIENTQILVEERCGQEQGLHFRYPETAKDTTYLSESGELCGWKDPRRRLPVAEENRMRVKILRGPSHSSLVLPETLVIAKYSRLKMVKPSRAKANNALGRVLTDQEVNPTRLGRMTKPYSPTSFIATSVYYRISKNNWMETTRSSRVNAHAIMLTLNDPCKDIMATRIGLQLRLSATLEM
ncbi:hypothetical protein Tco_1121166 [Tanacetum coccineum]|uniref:Uncharacterized protein n=1 Tax=Tanacetum coccineum TaxID=301880 RepID=A0ABQ5IWX6_9ASTR